MTFQEVASMIESIGLPFVYDSFPNNEAPQAPYIVFTYPNNEMAFFMTKQKHT